MKLFKKKEPEQRPGSVTISYIIIDPEAIERYRLMQELLNGNTDSEFSNQQSYDTTSADAYGNTSIEYLMEWPPDPYDEIEDPYDEIEDPFEELNRPLHELVGAEDPYQELRELEEERAFLEQATPGVPYHRDGKIYIVTGIGIEDRLNSRYSSRNH